MACSRCGRTDTVTGSHTKQLAFGVTKTQRLCHANPDGTKAEPDCYHIVTTGGT